MWIDEPCFIATLRTFDISVDYIIKENILTTVAPVNMS